MGPASPAPPVAPPHILAPLGSAELGGSELALLRLIDALPKDAARFSLWLFGDGPLAGELDRRGIPWRRLPPSALRTPWGLAGIWRRLRHERPDLIYLHAGRILSLLARRAGIPCLERINVPRAPGAGGWSRWPWIDRRCTRWATRALVVSHALRRQLLDRGVAPEQVVVLRDPIDPRPLRRPELRATVRARFGIDARTPLILNVGRLVRAKAHEDLLAAAAITRERLPRARFLILGDGPRGAWLRRRIDRLGLAQRVTLLPFDPEIAGYYAAADLFVQSSRWEGLPAVLLEARAAGVPVVATDAGGSAEALVGSEARLVAPGDPERLAAGILEALAGRREGVAGPTAGPLPEEFTPSAVAERFCDIIRDVLPVGRTERPGTIR
jgi:glycosyltransferase involved in cell wall biosynthesis